jgi:asparagine synthase (glutamine-hydrolysing)
VSVQYGRWNFDGHPEEAFDFRKAQVLIAPYGPDGISSHRDGGVAITYGAFHTTRQSRGESQPHTGSGGMVLTWDGRLDNREELIRCLREATDSSSTDVSIVAAAFDRWGPGCFARILGDWALSIWDPRQCSLLLAKDVLGVRPLFYTLNQDGVSWSSLLEPLLLVSGRSFSLNEEYIAGWFSLFPATQLTPYAEIDSVPPASYVVVRNKRATCQEYWRFDPAHCVRCATDEEYEERFRNVFAASIRRRLRADAPVTAELSGGMDSTSIVCMADELITRSSEDLSRLDTISYFDDAEPNWDERPYFSAVAKSRGRAGCHLAMQVTTPTAVPPHRAEFRATPASGGSSSPLTCQFADYFNHRKSRVLLSGIGGDEVLGGVPTPIPELADLLASRRVKAFLRRTTQWALAVRKPWIHLVRQTVRSFLSPAIRKLPLTQTPPEWLTKDFVKRHRDALQGYERRLAFDGVRPSFHVNLFILEALRRQLACNPISSEPLLETRYPYLDRELLQFLYAIPREQLVRPNQRRSLMRRALAGTVPTVVLNRRQKASASRNPLTQIASQFESLIAANAQWESARLGIIDQRAIVHAVQMAEAGENLPLFQISRTLTLESWLRGFAGGPFLTPLTLPLSFPSELGNPGSNGVFQKSNKAGRRVSFRAHLQCLPDLLS